MESITFNEFTKLDIRIGKIISAKEVEGADRLIELSVDIGEETPRTLAAGLKQYYQPDEMVGKKIVVLANLEPKKLRGIMSHGMLLAASTSNYEKVKLLSVDDDIPIGSKVS